ncbi:high mobility group protein B1-like [Perognathus longimembris pacificus]|uniref:high mobility group protein B1-like n=1 Tax=Perognathus longimembris pacificus TaxID=214514 RepID=UPI0020186F0E|nr:high mobility group protein B1-like [Perognathus longimembris pacificus]
MGKGDPTKPRGKMSSYAFFVQTCQEEDKKKHPDASVNFSEFSKKCSERWKTISAKEKEKLEDMANADKARYKREMKTYIPPKGETKKKFKDPNVPKRPPSAFFLFCSEYRPKSKGEQPGMPIGEIANKPGEMWHNTAADDKQPYGKKGAKLKEKHEKDIAAYRAKGKPDAAKKGVVKAEKSKKKKEEEEDEEDEEEEEDKEDEDEDDDDESSFLQNRVRVEGRHGICTFLGANSNFHSSAGTQQSRETQLPQQESEEAAPAPGSPSKRAGILPSSSRVNSMQEAGVSEVPPDTKQLKAKPCGPRMHEHQAVTLDLEEQSVEFK